MRSEDPDHSPLLRANHLLRLSDSQVLFSNVRAHVLYTKAVQLTNPLPAPVEVTVRPGNPERYSIEPAHLVLAPHATAPIEVRLKLQSVPAP